jgi:ABC-type branched-subunit amino acid transport system ATPase component
LFSLVDRVIVLVDGKKYMEGKPKEVQNDKRLK